MQEAIVLLMGGEFSNKDTAAKNAAAQNIVDQLIKLQQHLQQKGQPVREFILLAPRTETMSMRSVEKIMEGYQKNNSLLSQISPLSRYAFIRTHYCKTPNLPRLFVIDCPQAFRDTGKGKQLDEGSSSSSSAQMPAVANKTKLTYDSFMMPSDNTMTTGSRIFIILADIDTTHKQASAEIVNFCLKDPEAFSDVIQHGLVHTAEKYESLISFCNNEKYHIALSNLYDSITEKSNKAVSHSPTPRDKNAHSPYLTAASNSILQKTDIHLPGVLVPPVHVSLDTDGNLFIELRHHRLTRAIAIFEEEADFSFTLIPSSTSESDDVANYPRYLITPKESSKHALEIFTGYFGWDKPSLLHLLIELCQQTNHLDANAIYFPFLRAPEDPDVYTGIDFEANRYPRLLIAQLPISRDDIAANISNRFNRIRTHKIRRHTVNSLFHALEQSGSTKTFLSSILGFLDKLSPDANAQHEIDQDDDGQTYFIQGLFSYIYRTLFPETMSIDVEKMTAAGLCVFMQEQLAYQSYYLNPSCVMPTNTLSVFSIDWLEETSALEISIHDHRLFPQHLSAHILAFGDTADDKIVLTEAQDIARFIQCVADVPADKAYAMTRGIFNIETVSQKNSGLWVVEWYREFKNFLGCDAIAYKLDNKRLALPFSRIIRRTPQNSFKFVTDHSALNTRTIANDFICRLAAWLLPEKPMNVAAYKALITLTLIPSHKGALQISFSSAKINLSINLSTSKICFEELQRQYQSLCKADCRFHELIRFDHKHLSIFINMEPNAVNTLLTCLGYYGLSRMATLTALFICRAYIQYYPLIDLFTPQGTLAIYTDHYIFRGFDLNAPFKAPQPRNNDNSHNVYLHPWDERYLQSRFAFDHTDRFLPRMNDGMAEESRRKSSPQYKAFVETISPILKSIFKSANLYSALLKETRDQCMALSNITQMSREISSNFRNTDFFYHRDDVAATRHRNDLAATRGESSSGATNHF